MADIELKELLKKYHMEMQWFLKNIFFLQKREINEEDIENLITRFKNKSNSYLKVVCINIKDFENYILVETIFKDTSYNNQTTELEYKLIKKYYKYELKCGFMYET